MHYKHFIGIDVSKKWLDFTVLEVNQKFLYKRVENSLAAIKKFFKQLSNQQDNFLAETLICMEHTGIYNAYLLSYLTALNANICLESGLQIKQSSGLKRGKNDKIDSMRIATYAYKNREEIKLWKPRRAMLDSLKNLITLRNRLITVLKQLQVPLKEAKGFLSKEDQRKLANCSRASINAVKTDLAKLDKEIKLLIEADPELNRLYTLITSVTGIGPVTAAEILVTTNEFKAIDCAKKYACYSGVAPFEHQSGSSIRGKTRVSSMGNKQVKKLLHMAALSACNCVGELKTYFDRKVAEGKNKMLVINAIRNKLLARIFACVKQNRLYQKNISTGLLNP